MGYRGIVGCGLSGQRHQLMLRDGMKSGYRNAEPVGTPAAKGNESKEEELYEPCSCTVNVTRDTDFQ